jgi:hypothetical protein
VVVNQHRGMTPPESEFHDRAAAVLEALRVDAFRLPIHLIYRLSALAAGEAMPYGSVRYAHDGRQQATGEAVVSTETRVIHAVFADSPTRGEPERGTSTVTCGTWARSSLARLSFEGDGNHDWEWHHEWSNVLPQRVQVNLRYAGSAQLTLPLDPTAEVASPELSRLLPSLLRNLGPH